MCVRTGTDTTQAFPACPTELSSHSLFLAACTALGILIFQCEHFLNSFIHCCPKRSSAFESPGFYLQRKSRRTPGSHGGGEKAPQKDKGSKNSTTSHQGLNLKARSPNLNSYSNIYAPSWGTKLWNRRHKTLISLLQIPFVASGEEGKQAALPDHELKARTVSFTAFSSHQENKELQHIPPFKCLIP